MNISEVQKLVANMSGDILEAGNPKNQYWCITYFEGGTRNEGIVMADIQTEAIIKIYKTLEYQDVLEIVLDIECELMDK